MPDLTLEDVSFLTRDEIEARALEVRRKHGLEAIPLDLIALADREGIQVNNAKFTEEGIAGLIYRSEGEVRMLVKSNDPPWRKRFTIAHELGHYCLHLPSDGEFVDRESNLFRRQQATEPALNTPERKREIQANMFAAALLMPETDVRDLWKRIRSLKRMARLFNVSTEAMGNRLDALGLD